MLKKVPFIFVFGLLMVLLSACGSTETATTQEPVLEEAATSVVAEPTVEQATEEKPVEQATVLPTPQTDTCLECHSNKETLVAMAKPEEVVESESSGVG